MGYIVTSLSNPSRGPEETYCPTDDSVLMLTAVLREKKVKYTILSAQGYYVDDNLNPDGHAAINLEQAQLFVGQFKDDCDSITMAVSQWVIQKSLSCLC